MWKVEGNGPAVLKAGPLVPSGTLCAGLQNLREQSGESSLAAGWSKKGSSSLIPLIDSAGSKGWETGGHPLS